MNGLRRHVLCFPLILASLIVCAQETLNVHQIAHRLDDHYNRLQSLQADFEQIYRGAGQERVESGKLWLKKPGKMRWEYSLPRPKLFVVDGHNAFFHVQGETQAHKSSLKKLDDLRSPLRYLLGKTRIEKEFDQLAITNDPTSAAGNITLRGIPRALNDRITEAFLEVNQSNEIVRILTRQADGSETQFRFSHIVSNAPAPEDLFHFAPPAGVQMVENESLSP